ncbi:tryptophan-rich sensory protein [Devosia sp. WQ 349]|uniref:TspO/MBR family protein n=1 Tax=Devosia sp. WQ 349K1 TaxID=2800329 RepID=UPI0019067D66|nr:TspO/MBR family protein [Devosia sp. WQ 349K1]MBK1794148.1 tryptophan-rich sensory protein [Devosia sp. WQ 349K1]
MSAATTDYRTPQSWIVLAVFIVAVVGIGSFIGTQTPPGPWFESLAKPSWNPPAAVFAPVWTILYVMIAIAGWRVVMDNPKSKAMMLWYAQMVLNFLWSPVWFGAEMPWLAFGIIVVLWVTIVAFILTVRHRDTLAAWLFVPYLAWVSFATVLCGTIAAMNS